MTQRTPINRKPRVLVLGGYGFIGRHIVKELEGLGADVVIGTRKKPTTPNECQFILHKLGSNEQWHSELENIDVLINTVGILRQRWGESYQQVHHLAVKQLANACEQQGIRLIHISALGLNNAVKSRFLTSKLAGEHALVNSKADWFLVRPSLVDGVGGFGARWFERVATWPIHFIPTSAKALINPITAHELGLAVAKIAFLGSEARPEASRIYQLGGTKVLTLIEYLNLLKLRKLKLKKLKLKKLKRTINNTAKAKQALIVRVPSVLARLLSHVCDLLHITPFSFGHYELLKFDNVAQPNRLDEVLQDKYLSCKCKCT